MIQESVHPLDGARFELALGGKGYPDALAAIPRPPQRLYGIGCSESLREGIAIVGARKATPYGRKLARHFAGQAVRMGITVISGGAYGCDSEAHRGALEARGKTVVFLGGGCDKPYPARHTGLFQQVIDTGGAVVSEYEWGFEPLPFTFRERNRLIAGLAKATLIVEAGLPSGTFSTADEALAANRDVLVVPGAITSPSSKGANRLLCQGAIPVVDDETFADALTLIFGTLFSGAEGAGSERIRLGAQEASEAALAWAADRYGEASWQVEAIRSVASQPVNLEGLGVVLASKGEMLEASRIARFAMEAEIEGKLQRYPDGRLGVRF